MTISIESVEDAFRNAVLSGGTNTRVIFFRPNAPRPELPYTTIQYLVSGAEINDWYDVDGADVGRYYGFRNLTFTVNCYGDNARQEIENLKGGLLKNSVREGFRTDTCGSIHTCNAPVDLSDLIDDEFETRFSMDVECNINFEDGSTFEDPTYTIEEVDDVEWVNRPPES